MLLFAQLPNGPVICQPVIPTDYCRLRSPNKEHVLNWLLLLFIQLPNDPVIFPPVIPTAYCRLRSPNKEDLPNLLLLLFAQFSEDLVIRQPVTAHDRPFVFKLSTQCITVQSTITTQRGGHPIAIPSAFNHQTKKGSSRTRFGIYWENICPLHSHHCLIDAEINSVEGDPSSQDIRRRTELCPIDAETSSA